MVKDHATAGETGVLQVLGPPLQEGLMDVVEADFPTLPGVSREDVDEPIGISGI